MSLLQTEMGLTVSERFERFKLEAMSELALRLMGGLMVAGSMLLWLILPMESSTDQMLSHGLLAAIFTATGLVVYAYGTRGFRRQMSLDAKRRTLSLTKVNIHNQSRVAHNIDVSAIESVFLRRPSNGPGFASLYVRVAGNSSPQLALTGETRELEIVHRAVCDIVQSKERGIDPSFLHTAKASQAMATLRA